MKRRIQHPLAWSFLVLGAALALQDFSRQPVQSQAKISAPIVEKAAHQGYVEKLNADVSFEMLPIPGGTYLMGSPAEEKKRGADEGPQHPVTVPAFWMGKFEVTWDEYDWFWTKRFPGGQPPPRPDITKKPDKLSDALTSPTPPYADETFGHGRTGNPVLAITHHAAMEYCRWLSDKTGKKYRLPTEAEWEWACRAGTVSAFSFGDDAKKLGEHAWIEDNADEKAHKIGKKKPNPWGLYDMHGNVAEWCIDRYRKDIYGTFPLDKASLNPFNPPTENRYQNVARGGSYIEPPEKCRSASRLFSEKRWLARDPQSPKSIWWMTEADYVGFRVVRTVSADDPPSKVRSLVNWWSPD